MPVSKLRPPTQRVHRNLLVKKKKKNAQLNSAFNEQTLCLLWKKRRKKRKKESDFMYFKSRHAPQRSLLMQNKI